MKSLLLLAFMPCALLLSAQSEQDLHDRHSRIAILNPDQKTISELQHAGIDLVCGSVMSEENGIRTLTVECNQHELTTLTKAGIAHQIIIDNVEAFYTQRAVANLANAKAELRHHKTHAIRSSSHSCTTQEIYQVPEHFELGDLGGFLYYEEIIEKLELMALLYPDLVTIPKPVSDSIRTRQGRPVYWVKISDNTNTDETEPEVLYTALTHAREPASAMSLLYYMWYLLENYEHDPEVRRIVDHTELYFVPVLNPDGYVYNATILPSGGGMWRKNLHDNDGNNHIDGRDGVDLNRNYGYLWGFDDFGSSPDPTVSTYRGDSPFSEPETRMLREFVLQREFVTAMHDHSYGNDLYHSWDHGPAPLPHADALYKISDQMCWQNRYQFGETHNTYWLGAINGGVNDWFYGDVKTKPRIFSWLPEIGDAFWPDPLNIVKICQDQMLPHLMVARIAGQHVEIHDLNAHGLSSGVNKLHFRVENLGLQLADLTVSVVPLTEGVSVSAIQNEGVLQLSKLLESKEITVDIMVDHRVADGSIIQFELIVRSEHATVATHAYSEYLNPQSIDDDEIGSNPLDKWVTDFWGLSIDPNNHELVSITDSPEGTQLNDFNTIRLKDTISLKEVNWAKASFMAKWAIETTHDFVQFQAKESGGEWTAFCGRYTKGGAVGNVIDVPSPHAGQPLGQPVYDGRQVEWIHEVIDLSQFVGADKVEFRFVAWSGGTVSQIEEDGYYFHDFNIYTSRNSHCTDQILNADETDVDCGGIDCAICPTCDDQVQNGIEEGVDCGGDCVSCPDCSDAIQNGDEEGIDCGGPNCTPCITCADGILNGSETGVDCGGDCDVCPPSCNDGILNGSEEEIDCGGSCPNVCPGNCCGPHLNPLWFSLIGLSVEISPNPAGDLLSVYVIWKDGTSSPQQFLGWEIIDTKGIHYQIGNLWANTQINIDVSDLSPQLYLLRISDSEGRFVVQRFLKQD